MSHDTSKEVIIAHFLKKKYLQPHPAFATSLNTEGIRTVQKITMNDKFHLINVIFSDDLSDLAVVSKDSSTRAELDAG